jgi:hypothetical protein
MVARKFGLNNGSAGMSALGQKQTYAVQNVRFTPNSDRESEFPH